MMKKVILGISSSIAAYKSCDMVRMLVREGCSVFPVLTEHAEHLVSPLALETLSGNPVFSAMFKGDKKGWGHIELKKDASLLLVAPATANIIGKFANGIADDLLSTTFLSVECPVMVAPAMNPSMYRHPAVRANLERLRSWGVHVIEPAEGTVACGDIGTGKLAEVETIVRSALDVIKR
jgi:phosphopantothenoylcysteine decarboxylase/phosphopantothenoylcysteine decarboxylase/phosphopantothenate--cysteine ligase